MGVITKRITAAVTAAVLTAGMIFATGYSVPKDLDEKVDGVMGKMTLDEKISQMIIPAIRTWDEENITELDKAPEIKKALQKHQYGGIILFGSNIENNEQVTRLLYDLQENNKNIKEIFDL